MGQQPNIDRGTADLPRPTHQPHAPRRWAPSRPAELGSPGQVPWGGLFGTPGPDTGYALVLLADREIRLAPGESRREAVAAITAVMAARASHLGRAPVAADADVAELILGYHPDVPSGHADAARVAPASVDTGVLGAPLEEVRRRAAAGEIPAHLG